MNPRRMAAGGIILSDDATLLLRYGTGPDSYLVGPGGAVGQAENVEQAVVRETIEETGGGVHPRRVFRIEDLKCSRYCTQ